MLPVSRLPVSRARFPAGEYGFTLLEITLALLILSVALIPILGASRETLRLMEEGRVQSRAALTLAHQLDRLRLVTGAPCGSALSANGIVNGVRWHRSAIPAGPDRFAMSVVSAGLPGRVLHDTLTLRMTCR